MSWDGRKAADTQALQWPRDWVVDPDSPNHFYYDNDEIPQRVKDAQCEYAFEFIRAGTTDIAAADTNAAVIRKKVDVLETEWSPNGGRPTGIRRYPRIMALISPLLCGSPGPINLVRG